eukprot:1139926-Rhodomonas_salina.2
MGAFGYLLRAQGATAWRYAVCGTEIGHRRILYRTEGLTLGGLPPYVADLPAAAGVAPCCTLSVPRGGLCCYEYRGY